MEHFQIKKYFNSNTKHHLSSMYSPLVFMISALRLIVHECLWCRIPVALSHKHLINCLASEVSDSQ